MGQKINPNGLRVGIIRDWSSRWYADDDTFADYLVEDNEIRNYIKDKLYTAGIYKIEIERMSGRIRIHVHTSKPGIVIGRGGSSIEELRKEVQKLTEARVMINIVEVKRPEANAQLIAENIALQLENRVSFRRAMKQSMGRAMKAGVEGIKVSCSGRLGGAEMARIEHYSEGSIPLQTLRADIEFGLAEANTTYGKIGVKVWTYKGEVLPQITEEKVEGSDN